MITDLDRWLAEESAAEMGMSTTVDNLRTSGVE
jgi:hypothetical protein